MNNNLRLNVNDKYSNMTGIFSPRTSKSPKLKLHWNSINMENKARNLNPFSEFKRSINK